MCVCVGGFLIVFSIFQISYNDYARLLSLEEGKPF